MCFDQDWNQNVEIEKIMENWRKANIFQHSKKEESEFHT